MADPASPPDAAAAEAALIRSGSTRERAARALRSGTVAAAAAIASVTPHGTGAIDVVMVRAADGGPGLASSPFYVRFGKYTGARSVDRAVRIEVNGKDAGFCMHLGRTGEAWFLAQDEDDWDDRARAGFASPLGYSSGEDGPPPPPTALGAAGGRGGAASLSPRARSVERPPTTDAAPPYRALVGSAPTRSATDARLAAAASPPPLPPLGGGAPRPPHRSASSSSLGRPPLPATVGVRVPSVPSDDDLGTLGAALSPDPAPRSPLGAAVDAEAGGEGGAKPASNGHAGAPAVEVDAVSGRAPSPPPRGGSPSPDADGDDAASSSSSSVASPTPRPRTTTDDVADAVTFAASVSASPRGASPSPAPPPPAPPSRAGPTVDLAIVPPADIVGASPEAVRVALDAGAVSPADWRARGGELASHPHLLAVVGGVAVHRRPGLWRGLGVPAAPAPRAGGPRPPPPAAADRDRSGSADPSAADSSRLASLRGWIASFRASQGGVDGGPLRRPSPLAPDAARDAALAAALARASRHRRHRRSFLPTAAQLASLPVSEGRNTVDFVFGRERLRAYIYVLPPGARVVVSDIDGTVTRSDIMGHLLPRVGVDWSHGGIARLFTDVAANGYHLLYLSSRSIAQASATRDYLHSVDQGGDRLPTGPVLMSPDGLVPSLYRELVLRRPHEFKIRCLEDVRALFPPGASPFYAGFGNRDTDEASYLAVGIPPPRTFIINPRGELRRASGGVVTSGTSTLAAVHAIVHDVFPPLPDARGGGRRDDAPALAAAAGAPAAAAAAVAPASSLLPRTVSADALLPLPPRGDQEAFNDANFWRLPPPVVVDSDGEEFADPEGRE